MELIQTFTNNILPILLISGAGYLLGKYLAIDARTLGRIIFYILSPALAFTLLTDSQLPITSIALMMAYAASTISIGGGIAWLVGRAMRLSRTILLAFILTSMFDNAGNFGLPVISFAFGQDALAYASIFFVTSKLMINTVGVFIASLGNLNLKGALLGLLKVPSLYAVIAALIMSGTGWQLPIPIERTVTLLASGAIPAMLILLGLELRHAEWRKHLRIISISSLIRLVLGPLIGIGMVEAFGFQGAARQAGVIEASMPSAVLVTVLAAEYRLEPSLITATVFVSTLLSPITLTPLLFFMGN